MSTQLGGDSQWPQSAVINRLDVSNPDEDDARERARVAEAQGQSLQVVNNEATKASHSTPPSTAQQRQDFSHEKSSRRDTRLGHYILGQTLGEGEFGKVKLGWKQGSSTQVAVKIIRKEKLNDKTRLDKVNREVRILQGLDHPNIVRLHEMVETDRTMGIVLEYAPCGELFNYILNQRYLKDNHAKRLFAQLVSAVGYLHKKGIIHRDLKLENLLLDRNYNIIVTDFGFANRFDPTDHLDNYILENLQNKKFVAKKGLADLDDRNMRRGDLMATSCGSPCYAAPELVISDGLYTGRKVDVWSVGVILYAMLAGYLPYDDDPRNPDGDNINLLYSYISETELKFPDYVTPHARDLLKRILKPLPLERADLFEVARHSWLVGYESVVEAITSTTMTAPETSGAATSDAKGVGQLARSASARNASNHHTSPNTGGLISKHGNVGEPSSDGKSRTTRDNKRQTVQVEYMPPRQPQHDGREDEERYRQAHQPDYSQDFYAAQERPSGQYRREEDLSRGQFPSPAAQTAKPVPPPKSTMPPPSRPYRDVPRSVTDPAMGQITTSRPGTQGSMSGSRLPSRGSYGQPVAAQVATASAQGRFSQPRPSVSTPYGQQTTVPQEQFNANGTDAYNNFEANNPQRTSDFDTNKHKRGHSRSQTLSDLTQKVFGRTPSTKKTPERRPRPDRSHPPTSLRPVDSPTASSRKSSDGSRSFGVGRKSIDFNTNPKRASRRFSLLPRWGTSKPDLTPPQTGEMGEVKRQQAYNPQLDGSPGSRQPNEGQYPTNGQPPSSYRQPQQSSHGYSNSYNPQYRTASAGTSNSTQTWPIGQQSHATDFESPSRFDSPAVSSERYDRREKAPYEIENVSSSKKMQRGGPAQRVMDFFSGRRHKRSGMA